MTVDVNVAIKNGRRLRNDISAICINKPSGIGIIIPTLEIIQPNLFIVVVTTITEGVNGCDLAIRRVKFDFRYTPSIVGVSCNSFGILINDSDYVALKVLDEVLIIILLFARNVNRTDDVSVAGVDMEKLRTSK